ncbi:MAG: hypothetical protein ABIQ09_19225 [Jatrophihabitantaceae bacterium]
MTFAKGSTKSLTVAARVFLVNIGHQAEARRPTRGGKRMIWHGFVMAMIALLFAMGSGANQ